MKNKEEMEQMYRNTMRGKLNCKAYPYFRAVRRGRHRCRLIRVKVDEMQSVVVANR